MTTNGNSVTRWLDWISRYGIAAVFASVLLWFLLTTIQTQIARGLVIGETNQGLIRDQQRVLVGISQQQVQISEQQVEISRLQAEIVRQQADIARLLDRLDVRLGPERATPR